MHVQIDQCHKYTYEHTYTDKRLYVCMHACLNLVKRQPNQFSSLHSLHYVVRTAF